MNKLVNLVSGVMLVLSIGSAVAAQTHTKKNHAGHHRTTHIGGYKFNHKNKLRIGKGTADGSLTSRESNITLREQSHFQHDRTESRADGVVTPQERRVLKIESHNVSENIHRLRHNRKGHPLRSRKSH